MNKRGIALILSYMVIGVLTIFGVGLISRSVSERNITQRYVDSNKAFWLAEAGIQKALWVISNNPDQISNNDWLISQANTNNNLGNGSFQVQITTTDGSIKNITSKGTVSSVDRQIRIQAQNSWLTKIPGAVYSNSAVKVKFDKRDDAYIDGDEVAGIYASGDVKVKREGEGRIEGNPPILENQDVPEGLLDGIWDAFDVNALRETAKANGTYFSAEGDDEYNNPYNKKGKYTLPLELDDGTKISEGVFFFDARKGEPLDDDEVNPKNEIRVKLEGTTEKVSGIIVVVGDLKIKDTKDYDFLFDGVILVLDDLKIDDKKHHRRHGTNDSDIFIRGAVLSGNIIEKGKKRKKKPSIDIKNATIEYDPGSILSSVSSHWGIVPGTWQEL